MLIAEPTAMLPTWYIIILSNQVQIRMHLLILALRPYEEKFTSAHFGLCVSDIYLNIVQYVKYIWWDWYPHFGPDPMFRICESTNERTACQSNGISLWTYTFLYTYYIYRIVDAKCAMHMYDIEPLVNICAGAHCYRWLCEQSPGCGRTHFANAEHKFSIIKLKFKLIL